MLLGLYFIIGLLSKVWLKCKMTTNCFKITFWLGIQKWKKYCVKILLGWLSYYDNEKTKNNCVGEKNHATAFWNWREKHRLCGCVEYFFKELHHYDDLINWYQDNGKAQQEVMKWPRVMHHPPEDLLFHMFINALD